MKLIIKIEQPGHALAVSFYLHLRKQKYIKFKGTQSKTQKPVSTEDLCSSKLYFTSLRPLRME